MANSILSSTNVGSPNGYPQLIQRFNQFKQQYNGDPRAAVQSMIQSGQITQAQVQQIAQRLQNIIK